MSENRIDRILGEDEAGEYGHFERVANKLSHRPDLHAFLLLDSLVPGTSDIVSSTEHDEIYLHVLPDDLDHVATDEQLVDLCRCGVRYDSDVESLYMFAQPD